MKRAIIFSLALVFGLSLLVGLSPVDDVAHQPQHAVELGNGERQYKDGNRGDGNAHGSASNSTPRKMFTSG